MTNILLGKRILLVEDEYLIASDLESALSKMGAEIVGPVADLETGLRLAGMELLDAAVLDVSLKGEQSYPIAQVLVSRAVPFVFMTGYDDWTLPEAYRAAPKLTKPCTMQEVMAMVEQLVMPS